MPHTKRRRAAKSRSKARASTLRQKPPVKTAAKHKRRRTLDGIPLKRKVVWTYDTDSPEFKARRDRELKQIREQDAEREGMEFIEANLADPEVQKWWR